MPLSIIAAFYLVAPTNSIMQEMAQSQAKHETPMAMITESAVSWYFFIAAWGVLYVALSYAAKVGHAERSAAAYGPRPRPRSCVPCATRSIRISCSTP